MLQVSGSTQKVIHTLYYLKAVCLYSIHDYNLKDLISIAALMQRVVQYHLKLKMERKMAITFVASLLF
jgi:hypothetical protein